jgi:hypothetical protein
MAQIFPTCLTIRLFSQFLTKFRELFPAAIRHNIIL